MGDRFVTIVPQSTIAPLQRSVQNAAARLVFELGTREHVTSSLLQLHWLLVTSPLSSRVQGMLSYALLLRKVSGLHVQHREVRSVDLSRSRANLPSSSTRNFAMPQLRTKCGERAFAHAGTLHRRTCVLFLILWFSVSD